jgi:hypothetical protein
MLPSQRFGYHLQMEILFPPLIPISANPSTSLNLFYSAYLLGLLFVPEGEFEKYRLLPFGTEPSVFSSAVEKRKH